MKISILILIIIGFTSCTKNSHENERHEQLIGNWKTEYYNGSSIKTAYIFSFRENTCSYVTPFGEFSSYWISGDTLMIKEKTYRGRQEVYKGQLTFKFLIDSLTSDHLTLKPITDETKELFDGRPEFESNKINLSKVKDQFNWKPERIAFYSTRCLGVCPDMYLEIDSIGNLFFVGGAFTEYKGDYSGKITVDMFNQLIAEINCINLDNIKPFYEANWTDDQTCGVLIKTKDTIYQSSAYGFDEEPAELRILFHSLMELYKIVELTEDSTIQQNLQYWNFQNDIYPNPNKR